MTDSDRLVVRSRVGSETGGYDPERFAQQMRGLPPIDWDTEREMVIAEPFFSYPCTTPWHAPVAPSC